MTDPGRALYLHIGLPKTGTTSLQARLDVNRNALRSRGLLYPADRPDTMFRAAVEVLDWPDHFGLEAGEIAGTWAGLCDAARSFRGPALVSHEIFGRLTERHIERAFGELHGLEVHVVVTARDLARQVTAVWQERIKNGKHYTFEEWLEHDGVLRIGPQRARSNFWREQDLADVLARWAQFVPAHRIHVVTCPPAGSDPEELVRRFCDAVGIDPAVLVERPDAANESLGVVEVDLLRRVNQALGDRLDRSEHSRVVKHWFAQGLLAEYRTARAQTPRRLRPRLARVSRRWLEEIGAAGYPVHGDLADLEAVAYAGHRHDPSHVQDSDLVELAPKVIADLLDEVARLRSEGRETLPAQTGRWLLSRFTRD